MISRTLLGRSERSNRSIRSTSSQTSTGACGHSPASGGGPLPRQHPGRQIGERVGVERRRVREQPVQDRAHRPQVGRGVRVLAPPLLGRHVGGRPRAGQRRHRVGGREPGLRRRGLEQLITDACQSEVEQFDAPGFLDEDVAGLEIAVKDALGVGLAAARAPRRS